MRATVSGSLAGFLLLTLSSQVQAQAPRYVMKDLVKPSAALYCSGAASINAAGDVAMNCTYKGGTRPEDARWCLSSNWCFHFTTRLPWYYSLPTIWQANGTVRTLNFPTRTNATDVFVLDSGAVMAGGVQLDVNGRNTGPGGRWIWSAGSNQAEPYLPPAALAKQDVWLFGLRSNGLAQWNREGGGASYMVTPDGQVSPTPEVPPSSDVVRYAGDTVFNDQGMRVVTRWVVGPATQAEPFGTAVPQAWHFNGQQWSRLTLPSALYDVSGISLNALGHVVAHDRADMRLLWRPELSPISSSLPGSPLFSEQLRISDQDVIGGAVPIPNDSAARSRATVWVQGQPTDLNAVTASKPSNVLLMLVKAMNGKGQMVVSASDSSKTGDAAAKTVLLTPQ